MRVTPTEINDLIVLEPKIYGDERGYFIESYNEYWWKKHFALIDFVQDNESRSGYGVLRGLHYQRPPFTQVKLVRVIEGEVLDVVVDLGEDSPTYGNHYSILLSGKNKKQLLIPRGFAHGFVVLSNHAIFAYKVDARYSPTHEAGIRWDDADLNIDWGIPEEDLVLSEKDRSLPFMKEVTTPFGVN